MSKLISLGGAGDPPGPCNKCGKWGCDGSTCTDNSLFERLIAEAGLTEEQARKREVSRSPEFQRIKGLPRREWESRKQDHVEAFFMQHLRAPGGTMRLRPVQIAMLWEMHDKGGLFSQAKTGSGKCVDYASEIYDAAAGRRRTAGEFGPLKVKSLQRDCRIGTHDAVAFASGVKPCIRLKLADGSETIVSHDHPVLTQHGWQHAAQIAKDTLVATPRIVRQGPGDAITQISDEELKLAAYLLSDGGVSQSQTFFTNGTTSVVGDFLNAAVAVTGEIPTVTTSSLDRAAHGTKCLSYSVLKCRAFRDRWDLHGLAKHKRIPAEFWGLSDRQIGLFLNRFWACDGYITDKSFEIVLASEKMIDDLKFLLLRLGIHSRKKYKRSAYTKDGVKHVFDAWRLTSSAGDAVAFAAAVGPILGKEVGTAGLLSRLGSIRRNTNVDIVPVNKTMAKAIAEEAGWSDTVRSMFYTGVSAPKGGYVSRDRFRTVIETLGYRGKHAWLAYADVIWTPVTETERVGERPVADISVPTAGNFVCDGMIVHNTLVSLLGFIVLNSVRSLLIVPAALKEKTLRDMQRYRKDWLVPYIRIVSYELLGRPQSAGLLLEHKPDVVIMDEVHRVKGNGASRKRLGEYFTAFPTTKVVAMSGTIAKRSIKDYAHIADWCLRAGSPVPREFKTLMEWSSALDDEKMFVDEEGERTFSDQNQNLEPGALLELCSSEELAEPDRLRGVRKAYRRRLTDTPGVIATQEAALGVSLSINPVIVKDRIITQAASNMRTTWERPDGVELMDTFDMWRHLRTIACGFYFRWNPAPPREWRDARREWAAVVREILRTNRRGLHSEAPVREAVAAGQYGHEELGVLETWQKWDPQYDPEKNKEAIWLSGATLDAAQTWASNNPGIVWVSYPEFGQALAARTGMPFYWNKGLDAKGRFIEDHKKGTPMISSIHANSAGLNLQHITNSNLIVSSPTTGLTWEQAVSRVHREGQLADEVIVDVVAAIPEILADFDQALSDARRTTDMEGQEQRLCYADITIPPPHERGGLWQ